MNKSSFNYLNSKIEKLEDNIKQLDEKIKSLILLRDMDQDLLDGLQEMREVIWEKNRVKGLGKEEIKCTTNKKPICVTGL